MGNQKNGRGSAPESPSCTLVLSDTDNDLRSVLYVLWLTGLCDRQGRWRSGLRRLQVVHTGDWLNKLNPNPAVLDFLYTLQASAPHSCSVILLVGNHEVEIVQRAATGLRTRLNDDHLHFIRQQGILHVAGNILYLHGYPTLNLLALLRQMQQEEESLNDFNDRFRKALYEGRYALFRDREGLEMVGDIRNVRQYYMRSGVTGVRYGEQVSQLLRQLGIDTVIHGHRPNLLIQLDHELSDVVPGIRIINNDNKASVTGFGAAVVDERGYVRFINPKAMQVLGGEQAFRKKVRRILGTGKQDVAHGIPSGDEAVLTAVSRSED
ncbi:MAG: metallophosphoesterase [Magnetococcales bacterium]|nr:metallophosphoesterase [Magnetococcales bacterium]